MLLLTSISCGRSTTASNISKTTPQPIATSAEIQGPGNPKVEPPKTPEEALRRKQEALLKKQTEANKDETNTFGPPSALQPASKKTFNPAPTPEEMAGKARDNVQADTRNTTRSVIRYYNFLTDVRGLNLNNPKEMDGGTSAFKANDVLQFTFKNQPVDKPIAVLLAEFSDLDNQTKGTDFMRKITNNQRKLIQVNNYSMLVLGGDEKIYKILTDSLEKFR